MDLKEILKKLKLSEQTISMVLGALVIVVIGVLVFNYFRGVEKALPEAQPTPAPGEVKLVEEEGKMVPEGLPTTHKVEKGENLWRIAEKHYGSGYNWVNIAKENKLKNLNVVSEGQELTIPKAEVIKPVKETTFGKPISGQTYQTQKGDHLWGIAVRAYGDGYRWVEIAKANNLKNPDLIYSGNVLTLPR